MAVDLAELREDLGDEEAVRAIAQSFLDGARLSLAQLRNELTRRGHDEIRRLAHSIKGGAMNIGARDLQQAAQALELAAQERRDAELEPLFVAVRERFGSVEDALRTAEGLS